jgi:cation:H+ antiporter
MPGEGRTKITVRALAIAAAIATTLPGLFLRINGAEPAPLLAALIYGVAIIGAGFILAWATEIAQLDVARGLALAILAAIAVLPEYAVDAVFTWKAGENPDEYGPLALANMTGANRLLIGIGWSFIVFVALVAARRKGDAGKERRPNGRSVAVRLRRAQSIEIAFLTAACIYALTLPLKSTLTLIDSVVLVAIFVGYIIRLSRMPTEVPDLIGPAALVGELPTARRRAAEIGMFVFTAVVILLCAEPFAEGLVEGGKEIGIDQFLLVQWIAPLASETPELLAAGLFAWNLKGNEGLTAVVSSKVNQWTLLVGLIPVIFAISAGGLSGLPVDPVQRQELFLTAAQSIFAVALIADLSLDRRDAVALVTIYLAEFALVALLPQDLDTWVRMVTAVLYLVLAAGVIIARRRAVPRLLRDGFRTRLEKLAEAT